MSTIRTVTLIAGFFWGFAAAVCATPFVMAHTDDSPAPTALLLSKVAGDGPPEQYLDPGTVVHICFGTAAGVVLARLEPRYFVEWVSLGSQTEIYVSVFKNVLVYVYLLFVVSLVGIQVGLGQSITRTRIKSLLAAVVVYGVVLGLGFGFQLI